MNLVKCSNGHYYDGDKFDTCPHCSGLTENAQNTSDEMDMTVPLTPIERQEVEDSIPVTEPLTEPLTAPGRLFGNPADTEKTVGYYNFDTKVEPVVGWLVCIEGDDFGRSFNLKAGKNFVGRSAGINDIVIQGDSAVSREKHAIVIYDPKSCSFLVQPGMSSELFYVNDEVVLQAKAIENKDLILVGNTKLMFIPFCSSEFTWDDYKKGE